MSKLEIDRRQFIAATGAAGAAAVLFTPELFAQQAAALSVGYWVGSDSQVPSHAKMNPLPEGEEAPPLPTEVAAALALLQPDPAFLGTNARIRVRPMLHRRGAALRPFSLWAHFEDGVGSGKTAPFLAWQLDSRRQASAGISFVAPVEADYGLVFSLRDEVRRRQATRGPAVSPDRFFRFSLTDATQPKLVRGTYFLAPLPGAAAAPSWSALRVALDENGQPALHDASGPVSFDYLAITIDYAEIKGEE